MTSDSTPMLVTLGVLGVSCVLAVDRFRTIQQRLALAADWAVNTSQVAPDFSQTDKLRMEHHHP